VSLGRGPGGNRSVEDAIEHVLPLFRLVWWLASMFSVTQDLGLNPKQIGLDCSGATQAPQQRCQPKYQFALDRGLGIIVRDDSRFEAFFERALALDASNIDALVGAAWAGMSVAASFLADDRAARFAAAESTIVKTLSMAPNHAFAHLVLGAIYGTSDRSPEAIAELEHALALDRNLAYAHMMIGTVKTALGRAEEAEGHIREALRLSHYNPDPSEGPWGRWSIIPPHGGA